MAGPFIEPMRPYCCPPLLLLMVAGTASAASKKQPLAVIDGCLVLEQGVDAPEIGERVYVHSTGSIHRARVSGFRELYHPSDHRDVFRCATLEYDGRAPDQHVVVGTLAPRRDRHALPRDGGSLSRLARARLRERIAPRLDRAVREDYIERLERSCKEQDPGTVYDDARRRLKANIEDDHLVFRRADGANVVMYALTRTSTLSRPLPEIDGCRVRGIYAHYRVTATIDERGDILEILTEEGGAGPTGDGMSLFRPTAIEIIDDVVAITDVDGDGRPEVLLAVRSIEASLHILQELHPRRGWEERARLYWGGL